MTTIPREVAMRRPANFIPAQDDGRTIDGQWRARRGGMTGMGAFTLFAVVMFLALFTGFVLSLLSQHA